MTTRLVGRYGLPAATIDLPEQAIAILQGALRAHVARQQFLKSLREEADRAVVKPAPAIKKLDSVPPGAHPYAAMYLPMPPLTTPTANHPLKRQHDHCRETRYVWAIE